MSTRAYKIKEIQSESNSSFNLWHDETFTDYLLELTDFYKKLGDDATGVTTLTRKEIKQIEECVKEDKKDYNKIKECIKQVKKDLGNEDYINYLCY